MNHQVRECAQHILCGGYDLHTHTIPSHVDRSLDDVELIEQASAAGMKGVLIKCHYEPTGARAALVNRRSAAGSAKAYGAVALNHPVGGLNPYAAHSALHMGARIVFMPTRDAANCLRLGDMPGDFFKREGISIFNENGKLKPVLYDIMDIVKQYDAVLATGHISAEESIALCYAGAEQGVRMVLTHPEWERTVVSGQIQRDLAQRGVTIEKDWYNIAEGNCTAEQMVANIRVVGAEHCYLATDRGQAGRESPVEGMLRFIETLLKQGLSQEELICMVRTVPHQLMEP